MVAHKRTEHARQRALERYGISLTHHEIIQLITRIDEFLKKHEQQDTACVEDMLLLKHYKLFPPAYVIAVRIRMAWMPVVYSPFFGNIKTVLPRNNLPPHLQ